MRKNMFSEQSLPLAELKVFSSGSYALFMLAFQDLKANTPESLKKDFGAELKARVSKETGLREEMLTTPFAYEYGGTAYMVCSNDPSFKMDHCRKMIEDADGTFDSRMNNETEVALAVPVVVHSQPKPRIVIHQSDIIDGEMNNEAHPFGWSWSDAIIIPASF